MRLPERKYLASVHLVAQRVKMEAMQARTSALDAVMAWEAALSPPFPAHMFDDLLV